MAYRTTKKAVLTAFGHDRVLSVPFCKLQNLLSLIPPQAYTHNKYGKSADIYFIYPQYEQSAIAICTGQQPFGQPVPLELCKKYDAAALEIKKQFSDFEQCYYYLSSLTHKFVLEAIDGE